MQLLVRTMALHGRTGSGSHPHPILSWDTTKPGDMFCASTVHSNVCTQSIEGTQTQLPSWSRCILWLVAAFVGKIVACTMSVLDNVAGKRV